MLFRRKRQPEQVAEEYVYPAFPSRDIMQIIVEDARFPAIRRVLDEDNVEHVVPDPRHKILHRAGQLTSYGNHCAAFAALLAADEFLDLLEVDGVELGESERVAVEDVKFAHIMRAAHGRLLEHLMGRVRRRWF